MLMAQGNAILDKPFPYGEVLANSIYSACAYVAGHLK